MKLIRMKMLFISMMLCSAVLPVILPQTAKAAAVLSSANLPDIEKVIASPGFWGGSAFALGKDGSVWSWGSNVNGQFANGFAGAEGWTITPHRLAGLEHTKELILGNGYYMALKQDGTVMVWGGYKKKDAAPVTGKRVEVLPLQKVVGMTEITQLSIGTEGALAVKKDGTLWQWKAPAYSSAGYSALPAAEKVPGLSGVKWAGSGRYHAARLENGTLWVWGTGALNADTSLPKTPVPVNGLYHVKAAVIQGDSLVALTQSGAVWASIGGWNSSITGVPGIHIKLQKMPSLNGVNAIKTNGFFNLVQNQKGEYWLWGAGTNQKSLQKVAILSNIAKLDLNLGGFAAIRKDGTVWTWSHVYSEEGKLSFTQPKQIKGLQAPASFATGENSKYAVLQDGTVTAWGTNMFGQLGISVLESRPFTVSPILRPVSLVIDGKPVEPIQPPIFQEGRVFVPLRDLAESLGYTIGTANGILTMTKDGNTVRLHLQEGTYKLEDGRSIPMGQGGFMVSYTFMVPAAPLAQALGYSAKWESSLYRLQLQPLSNSFLQLLPH